MEASHRYYLIYSFAGGVIGILLTLIALVAYMLDSRPELKIWHVVELDEEFVAGSDVASFEAYLELEQRLFAQLDELVYAKTGPVDGDLVNRYKRGSAADPGSAEFNWNRSFEFRGDDPQAAVLLLHGLSDSPYSLRHLAETLHAKGFHVLVPRIPGHGTIPAALTDVSWQDMAAAVELAVEYLQRENPGKPLSIIGYSNGAALAVQHVLASLGRAEAADIHKLVLLSPEVGVTSVAAFAIWQERVAQVLDIEQLKWNSVKLEYDPYKYGSFAINAGDVSHKITQEIQRQITRQRASRRLGDMPPILAFTSIVDATVLPEALVDGLLGRLPDGGHELVVYDVNTGAEIDPLYRWDPETMFNTLKNHGVSRYSLSLVSNRDQPGGKVVERRWNVNASASVDTDIGVRWPRDLFSLSHVALPFPPHDPLYGNGVGAAEQELNLGAIALRGENNVLRIPPADMLRLRWNPFYAYQEQKILAFLGAE